MYGRTVPASRNPSYELQLRRALNLVQRPRAGRVSALFYYYYFSTIPFLRPYLHLFNGID